MNAFNIFRRNQNGMPIPSHNSAQSDEPGTVRNGINNDTSVKEPPEIPENIFVEYAKPKSKPVPEPEERKQEINDLQRLYAFLEQNLEKRGYEDALMNPDSSVMEEQISFIKNELSLIISKVKTYYTGYLRTIDFHIDTRRRGGLIETVDELVSHRQTVVEEISVVTSIEQDALNGIGLAENLIIGYKKGFRNAFAAITYSSVFTKRN